MIWALGLGLGSVSWDPGGGGGGFGLDTMCFGEELCGGTGVSSTMEDWLLLDWRCCWRFLLALLWAGVDASWGWPRPSGGLAGLALWCFGGDQARIEVLGGCERDWMCLADDWELVGWARAGRDRRG